jgi:hypothetical protein
MGNLIEPQQLAVAAADLQDAFFSPPNTFKFDSTQPQAGDTLIAGLSESLRRHRLGHLDRPVLLPFRAVGDECVTWYAVASTASMARALESELAALLGPSYATFALSETRSDVADNHALPLFGRANLRVLRFQATSAKSDGTVVKQWQMYCNLLDRRPRTASYIARSFEQLRAEFDRALLARHEAGAVGAIASLRERFGLSAENRLYLEIRLSAAFERWDEISTHRLLPTIVHLNLPSETYGDVMEAIYEEEVRPFEKAERLEDLLAEFSNGFLKVAMPLLRTRRSSRRPAAVKAFLLQELVQNDPKAEACEGLLTQLPPGAFGSLDSAVRVRVAALARVDGYSPAQEALDREEFDRAYDLLWPLADDVRVLRGLVLCARESEEPTKSRAVLERLATAPADVRETVEASSPGRMERLRKLVRIHVTQDARIAEQIARAEGESLDSYIERWRELARSAAPIRVLSEPGVGAAAADCILRQAVDEPDVFERTYPLWHELFVERIEPDNRLLPVYEALLDTTRLRPFSDPELQLLHQIVMALVHAGADKAQYGKAIDEVRAVFMDVRSPHVLTWALNLCDALALAPARDSDARLRLLTSVVQTCAEYRARLTRLQWSLLKLLCAEAGIECPAKPDGTQDTEQAGERESLPSIRLVALYSLDEASIRRAVQLLKELQPQLKVDSNGDEVCTPRLKALAQSADVFVFAWKSSKHAAYDCVKAALKTKDILVMARGAGTTSLVAAAIQRVQGRRDEIT